MKEQVQLDGLLFSGDTKLLHVMQEILGNFAIHTEVYTELGLAVEAVTNRRVDALIVDWDLANDPTRVVRSARKSSPNRNSTIVAMVDAGSETHALMVGANFMIYKPVDLDRANRCMRAAYGTMLQERRRAARVSADIPVVARVSGLGIMEARVSDLSIGGLALQCGLSLPIDREVSLVLPLPPDNHSMRITGKVVNCNETDARVFVSRLFPKKISASWKIGWQSSWRNWRSRKCRLTVRELRRMSRRQTFL